MKRSPQDIKLLKNVETISVVHEMNDTGPNIEIKTLLSGQFIARTQGFEAYRRWNQPLALAAAWKLGELLQEFEFFISSGSFWNYLNDDALNDITIDFMFSSLQ